MFDFNWQRTCVNVNIGALFASPMQMSASSGIFWSFSYRKLLSLIQPESWNACILIIQRKTWFLASDIQV